MSQAQLRTYEGAVAIITGGASGIGRALGEELARRKAEVVLADLQVDVADEVAAGITRAGGKASSVRLDVTDCDAVKGLVENVVAAAGRLDYMFNNAGIGIGGEVEHYEIHDWYRVIDVNLRGVINGVQAAYPIMKRQGFGHIVNTASVAGLVPVAGMLSYSTSKHAVVGLSTCLRVEAAALGIRVSALCPGAVETAIKLGKVLHAPPPEVQRRLWEQGHPISPERLAREALVAVAKNKAIIVIPWWWKFLWWLYRLSPTLGLAWARRHYLSAKRIIAESKAAS
jgi:NAD(P)-dependent dehydrogenase (short-subunit alcohol dehydrogenase family)